MKRYAALIVAALLALLGSAVFASSAQAAYPTPNLNLVASTQKVVSGKTFVGTATATVTCDTITETWDGQTATATGTDVVTHTFHAPNVKHNTVIPITAVCDYTTNSGFSGAAVLLTRHSMTRHANITVIPSTSSKAGGTSGSGSGTGSSGSGSGGPLPNTGGPNLLWLVAGGAAVLAGAGAMFAGRRRRVEVDR